MVQFNCPTCGKSMTVRDEHAGRHGKCVCGAVVSIPRTSAAGQTRPIADVSPEKGQNQTHSSDAAPRPARRMAYDGSAHGAMAAASGSGDR